MKLFCDWETKEAGLEFTVTSGEPRRVSETENVIFASPTFAMAGEITGSAMAGNVVSYIDAIAWEVWDRFPATSIATAVMVLLLEERAMDWEKVPFVSAVDVATLTPFFVISIEAFDSAVPDTVWV